MKELTLERNKMILIFFLVIFIFPPVYFLGAQGVWQGVSLSNISLEIDPIHPGAFETVTVEIRGVSVDLNRATISWYIDEVLIRSGIGATAVEFSTGSFGSTSRIQVIIETIDKRSLTKNLFIRPAEVNILWQAHSYTPPFYRGKALAPSSGLLTLTAMPEFVDQSGNRFNPSELIYTWSERGIVLGNTSGYGKQQIVLENSLVPQQPLVVSVVVSTFDKSIEASGNTRIDVYDPEINFYEVHPLEGIIYDRELSTTDTFFGEEITVRGEPFYFSLDDLLNGLVHFRWLINGNDISTPLSEQTKDVTLRKEGTTNSSDEILLKIDNFNLPFRVLQIAEKMLFLNLSS